MAFCVIALARVLLSFPHERSARQGHTCSEGPATSSFRRMVTLNVGLELCGNFLLPLLRAQLATSRKALPAIGTPPRDGSPVNFLYNN